MSMKNVLDNRIGIQSPSIHPVRGSHQAKKAVESQLEHLYTSDHNETSRVVEIRPPDGVPYISVTHPP